MKNAQIFFKFILLTTSVFILGSCAKPFKSKYPSDLPKGSSYYSDEKGEDFYQSSESFERFHDIGTLGCPTSILDPIPSDDIKHCPSNLNLLHPSPISFSHFPIPNTQHDTIDLEDTYAWKNEISSGRLIYGPFANIHSGGKLIATFNLDTYLYAFRTYPVNIPFKTIDLNPNDILFTTQLVADGKVLSSRNFIRSEMPYVFAAYDKLNEQIFVRYKDNDTEKIARMILIGCLTEHSVELEAFIDGPVKNVEARIILNNSPINISLGSTKIRHEYLK